MGEAAFLPQQDCVLRQRKLCDDLSVSTRAFVTGVRAYVHRICYSFTRLASLRAHDRIKPRR